MNTMVIPGIETQGNKVRKLCMEVLSFSNDGSKNEFKEITQDIAQEVHQHLVAMNVKCLADQNIFWKVIHSMIVKDSKWEGFVLKCINPTVAPTVISSLLYSLVTSYITQLLKQHSSNSQGFQKLKLELSKEEEKILYYVAGYLVFSLLKKYRKLEKSKKKHHIAIASIQFLESLRVSGDNSFNSNDFETYVQEWLCRVNRGGLVKVNQQAFFFIYKIEITVRNLLNISIIKEYRDEDLRSVLLKLMMESEEINSAWESVARHIPNELLKEILQKQFMKKWIDLRARAFVKTYIQILKRFNNRSNPQKLSKKAEPALRKTLT